MRKDPHDLTSDERTRLTALLRHSAPLRHAHTLREELTRIFATACSKADGLRRIGFWRVRVVKSGLTCFDRFLTLLDTWLDLIANYFIDHQTSGFVKGLNNKLKVLKRRCYGLRNYQRLFQRLTLDVSGYRLVQPMAVGRTRLNVGTFTATPKEPDFIGILDLMPLQYKEHQKQVDQVLELDVVAGQPIDIGVTILQKARAWGSVSVLGSLEKDGVSSQLRNVELIRAK